MKGDVPSLGAQPHEPHQVHDGLHCAAGADLKTEQVIVAIDDPHGVTITPPGRVCATHAQGTISTEQVAMIRS